MLFWYTCIVIGIFILCNDTIVLWIDILDCFACNVDKSVMNCELKHLDCGLVCLHCILIRLFCGSMDQTLMLWIETLSIYLVNSAIVLWI